MADENPNQLILQQIEETAGLYEPAVYELLTFYSALQNQSDELDGQFFPLTTVKPKSEKEALLFAVGFIPPTSNVTGRLLDRSASVANAAAGSEGSLQDIDMTEAQVIRSSSAASGNLGGEGGRQVEGVPGEDRGPPIVNKFSVKQLAVLIRDAYHARFNKNPTQIELAIYVGQSMRETGGNWPNNNPGYIGNYPLKRIPEGRHTFAFLYKNGRVEYYNSYSTPQAGAASFVSNVVFRSGGRTRQAAIAGDLLGYCKALHDGKYYTDTVEDYFGHYPNVTAIAKAIGDVDKLDPSTVSGFKPIGGDVKPPAGDWASTGSSNSSQANKTFSKTANRDLNRTDLGLRFLAAQASMIKALQDAISQMARTPPLRLLINPQSFRSSCEKLISSGNWGRNGPIIEHWGDQQDKIEGSGKIAAFYSIDTVGSSLGDVGNSPGLGRTARQFSQSYQNLQSLWLIYKNNGGIWLPDYTNTSTSKRTNLAVVGSVYLYFDGILYIGSFDNFNLSETEGAPFTLEYNFSFTVRAWFLLDRPVNPQISSGKPLGSVSPPSTINSLDFGAMVEPNVPLPAGLSSDEAARALGFSAKSSELTAKDRVNQKALGRKP